MPYPPGNKNFKSAQRYSDLCCCIASATRIRNPTNRYRACELLKQSVIAPLGAGFGSISERVGASGAIIAIISDHFSTPAASILDFLCIELPVFALVPGSSYSIYCCQVSYCQGGQRGHLPIVQKKVYYGRQLKLLASKMHSYSIQKQSGDKFADAFATRLQAC